ncbi:Vacuolar protein sorting-associated protein 4B [Stylosanthes scabra]|uniref:Vacuolar protein sorting-associated protein 4B n=1 Tax=Stylosanthes scabra TaxID=79078 RepID=A0ABU6Y5E6_9FABA|nr:Vacuolar protein sorting-associated protein 4B [Stylosanthes scabra]
MYSNFKEQAIEYVKQAVQEDNAGNYAKAFPLYMNALEYFKTHLKYEKNPKIREAITQKFTEYLRRAEEIRAVLDDGGPGPGASNGDAAVAARPKTKPKGGEGGGGGDGEDPEQAKLRAGLNSAIIREKPNVKWNDVAGLESAKQALQEAVILPVKFPQFFTGKRRPWRAFLLYGPPGTGKSYLAKAVATEADSTFFSISSSDLVSKWMGESEKLVSSLFQMARESAPSIIFIDEIDSLCGQRGEGNESEASRRIKTELLVQMQGVGHNDQKVLVLAATNTPYALDQAIRRRFDKRIYIPLPDLKARQHMFKVHLGDTPNNLTEKDFEYLASRTDGFSGSDISVCVKDVLFEPVRKTQDAMFFYKNPEGMWVPCGPKQPGAVQTTMQDLAAKGLASKILPPPITRTDFEKVLARQRPTVSKADLDVHERFTKEFGEEGASNRVRETSSARRQCRKLCKSVPSLYECVAKPGGSRASLNSVIRREKPNVKWSDVAGLERAKQAFQEAVILPLKFPQFFTGKGQQKKTFLMYGPPDAGKSYLAKAVATEADFTLFSVSSSDQKSKWKSESAKLISSLFQTARENVLSIILVDEIDSLYGEGNENEASTQIKTELLVHMQDVGHSDQKILVLAATNAPYALDQPIRRRFDKLIYIPLPDLKARQHMFKARAMSKIIE